MEKIWFARVVGRADEPELECYYLQSSSKLTIVDWKGMKN